MPPNPTKPTLYTPYRHTSEIAMVRDWFFPHHSTPDPYSPFPPDMRQTAISHVQMWSLKDPKLAHAIIATANLTDAILHDTLDRRKCISDWALRSIYAMAFCRFVNGFVDRDVVRKANATTEEGGDGITSSRGESSMYAHAGAIGMPERFVDLRHQATHDEMPSLEVLRLMSGKGLDWLWERWWKVNSTDDAGRALREREERMGMGVRKMEERRMRGDSGERLVEHEIDSRVESTNSVDTSSLRADQLTNGGAPDDMLCLNCRKRKRKRGLKDDEDMELQVTQGQEPSKAKKRANTRAKNAMSKSAFGLFEC